MAIQAQQFNQVTGMNMDISPSKRPNTLSYQIKNMRVTLEDSNTLMSWTNEKGTQPLEIYSKTIYESTHRLEPYVIEGQVLGTCVLNDFLILFVHIKDSLDCIQGISFKGPIPLGYTFYRGNLNFQLDSKFETLGIYENEIVQKVYWIDGVNQPRVINIAGNLERIFDGNESQFDFIPADTSDTRITIKKGQGLGTFKAGTIQYFFTYYNLNGQQSNIFYQSPIYYVAQNSIGSEVDKQVSCYFDIQIQNPNPNFDFIRVYSVQRSSVDTAPLASIVKDIQIPNQEGERFITTQDLGTSNTGMEYSELLFMNNTPVIPSTMDSKDNTLFLGNLKYGEVEDEFLKTYFVVQNQTDCIEFRYAPFNLTQETGDTVYPYTNQLSLPSESILGFKGGETYLFGFQLQDTKDRWTSIIPLGNVKNDLYPKYYYVESERTYKTLLVKAYPTQEFIQKLTDFKKTSKIQYKAIRFSIVQKSPAQRNVICQGIVNPTVYCYENRINGEAPFAQASWFFRPQMRKPSTDYITKADTAVNEGGILEFRHFAALGNTGHKGEKLGTLYSSSVIGQSNAEIQGMFREYPQLIDITEANEGQNSIKSSATMNFGVDASIVTLNSPDIEFSSTTQALIDRNEDLHFSIVGYSVVKTTLSDYEMQLENNSFHNYDSNRFYRIFPNLNKKSNTSNPEVPAAGQVSVWGTKTLEYSVDKITKDKNDDSSDLESIVNKGLTGQLSYNMVYPWQRSTSAIEQNTPPTGMEWGGPIKTKILSNNRVCGDTVYLTKENRWSPDLGITGVQFCDDTTKMVKIEGCYDVPYTYYGQVDTLLTAEAYDFPRYVYAPKFEYQSEKDQINELQFDSQGLILTSASLVSPKLDPDNWSLRDVIKKLDNNKTDIEINPFKDPIRMKYKSSAHVVFAFRPYRNADVILPVIADTALPEYYGSPIEESQENVDYWKAKPLWRAKSFTLPGPAEGSRFLTNTSENYIEFVFSDNPAEYCNSFLSEGKYKWGSSGRKECIIINRIEPVEGVEGLYTAWGWYVYMHYWWKKPRWYDFATLGISYAYSGYDNEMEDYLMPGTTTFKNQDQNGKYVALYSLEKCPNSAGYTILLTDKQFKARKLVDLTVSSSNQEFQGKSYSSKVLNINSNHDGVLYIGELTSKAPELSVTDYDLGTYTWQIASNDCSLTDLAVGIELYGDSYFQRYDCLKTYPYTDEDPNQIVEIASVMLETYINIDGRWDRNRGLISNNNITNTNFNLINNAYSQQNTNTQSYITDSSSLQKTYPNTVTWTLTKVLGEEVDKWTKLTNTSMLDLDGDAGSLTKILNFQNTLLFFQEHGMGVIKYNQNVAMQTNTGLPVELANSGKVDGKEYLNKVIGCQNKDAIIMSKQAVYFLDGNTKSIYLIGQAQDMIAPKSLSDNAFVTYLRNQDMSTAKFFYNRYKQDVYFVFDNYELPCLTYNEQAQQFTSFYDYTPSFVNNIGSICYHIKNSETPMIWMQNMGDYNYFYNKDNDLQYFPFYMTVVANGHEQEAVQDKIFNNLEFRSDSWDKQGKLLDDTFDELIAKNEYQFGVNSLTQYGRVQTNMAAKTGTQLSKDIPSTLKKKFRVWRANFPRALNVFSQVYLPDVSGNLKDSSIWEEVRALPEQQIMSSRDRIRNPWTYVTLRKNAPNTDKLVLHDMIVYYYS